MPIPQKIQPVEKSRVSDTVYEMLKRWIIDGDLGPGEDLRDAELAKSLGVSRTPVREALKQLENEGLVCTSANKWTRVAEIRTEDVENLFPIIKSLDILALENAFRFMNPDGVAEMRAAYRDIVLERRLAARGDEDELANPRVAGLVDRVLDQRPVDQRHDLFRDRLGRGKESGAQARHGEDGLGYLLEFHRVSHVRSPLSNYTPAQTVQHALQVNCGETASRPASQDENFSELFGQFLS